MSFWGNLHGMIQAVNSVRPDPMIRILKIALGEVGVTEWSGPTHNQEVLKYFRECGFREVRDDETSWCSAYLCWCVQKAGFNHTGSLVARSWLEWGGSVFEPQLGDVTVFWRNDLHGWQGHVGLFIRRDGKSIWTIGGNQGNSVNISNYPGGQLLGYRRLK